MKINKHIQALAEKRNLGTYQAQILQYLWNNKNKRNLFCLNVASVSASGMSRQFKAVIHFEGSFVNVTSLICKVTNTTYNKNKDTVAITGCGMDMGFALLENFYAELIPKTVKTSPYKFSAVQNYFLL